jgi:hypothetical protein
MKILFLISFITFTSSFVLTNYKNNDKIVETNYNYVETTRNVAKVDRLYFSDLRKYRMGAREVPADLKKYDGQTIQIVGFMVPFDSIEKIDRFILLQAPFMGCYHVPPPQPNESLMINSGNTNVKYTYEPILITGKLKIEETYIDRYLVSLYTITATKIEEVNQDAAELDGLPAGFHMFGEF